MNNGFWNEQDEVSGYELLSEQAQEAEEIAEEYELDSVVIEADEEELEEVTEAAAFDLDQDESNMVYNARLRLEQARLYEMLINHPLFDGVDVDPRAIKIVQSELKHYIVKRLEILMGLHKPVEKTIPSSEVFNDVEANFLKQLAFKGTKGASTTQSRPLTVKPKTSGLKPLGTNPRKDKSKPTVKGNKLTEHERPAQVEAPHKPAPRAKVAKRRKPRKTGVKSKTKMIKNTGPSPREMTKSEVELIARKDLEDMKKRKPWAKMTSSEKSKEIKRVNEEHAKVPPSDDTLPQMSYEEQERLYMTRQMNAKPGTMGELNNTIARIMMNRTESEE